jgi:hypothetical protein
LLPQQLLLLLLLSDILPCPPSSPAVVAVAGLQPSVFLGRSSPTNVVQPAEQRTADAAAQHNTITFRPEAANGANQDDPAAAAGTRRGSNIVLRDLL